MSKKTIFLDIAVLVFIFVAATVISPDMRNYFKNLFGLEKSMPQYVMAGTVVETGEGWVVVEGMVSLETRKINFVITPETLLTKRIIRIEADNFNKGPFTPKTENSTGEAADLIIGRKILEIKSKTDLLSGSGAEAASIIYLIYDIETPQE